MPTPLSFRAFKKRTPSRTLGGLWSRLLFGVALLSLGGCSYSDSDEEGSVESSSNSCISSSECVSGSCVEGICQAGATELDSLLFEITPAGGTEIIAGLSFTQVVDGADIDPRSYDLLLPEVSDITGTLRGAAIDTESCVTNEELPAVDLEADTALPFRLTMTPRDRRLGLARAPQVAELTVEQTKQEGVRMAVTPGLYDLYIEPQSTVLVSDPAEGELPVGCVRPPFLIVNREIEGGEVNLMFEPPQPQLLGVTVRFPGTAADLSEWTVDLIERDTGRVLSNRARLGEAQLVEENLEYQVQLAFSQPLVDGVPVEGATELVRLSPPEDTIAPTFYVERSVVDLFQDGQGLIDQLKSLPDPVTFSAPVASQATDGKEAVPATVTIVATSLDSTSPGTVALFSQTVETNEGGSFEAKLLPGTYKARVEPQDEEFVSTEWEFSVSDSAKKQVGQVVLLEKRERVEGFLESFNRVRLPFVPVFGTSLSSRQTNNVFDVALGRATAVPKITSISTDEAGLFSVYADPGSYHLTFQPPAGSGFAWGIVPGIQVGEETLSVGRVRLPPPVVIRGQLRSNDARIGSLKGALIRAHALLNDGELVATYEEADSAVAVGEARVTEADAFRLLLPSSFK